MRSGLGMNYRFCSSCVFFLALLFSACQREAAIQPEPPVERVSTAFQGLKSVSMAGVSVDVVIDKPALPKVDVLLLFHGTVMFDSLILGAAQNTLEAFKRITDRSDLMFVSVAYPEQNLLMGDNLLHAEAALLWLKNAAADELGVEIGKIFLAGHSQGGYLAVRLNHLYEIDGVVANAPGPLNLLYRCDLEERGVIPSGITCTLIRNTFGPTTTHPWAYHSRSLLAFTAIQKSPLLLVQGMNDSPIQMQNWPIFKQQLAACTACDSVQLLEIPQAGHSALFERVEARPVYNAFLNR